jgi:dihydroorotate dehydrogenase
MIDQVDGLKFTGEPSYWPDEVKTVSMANSFGIASFAPDWWVEDIRRARRVVREGHQVLIVSVVASRSGTRDTLIEDFVEAALLAKKAGADIIEANYSCPNTPDDRVTGDLYKSAETAGEVSRAIKEALGKTPLFVKIGYLSETGLSAFMEHNKRHIDGIVAINTIPAKIVDAFGNSTFCGEGREFAGVSGWAIRSMAHQVSRNLVKLRDQVKTELHKDLTIIGLGGVLVAEDAMHYLDAIGTDAVESCTGAFLNPNLALHTRFDTESVGKRPSRAEFELKTFGKFLSDVILHPSRPTRLRVDTKRRRAVVE